jgi:autotransporter-associated beta strand protein
MEPLEDRHLLSLCVWDGGGGDNHWSTPLNWGADVAPVAGDDLCFAGIVQTSTQNDFTAGTSFKSIEFAASNFSLSGNDLAITDDITVNSGVTGSSISLNIDLSGTPNVNAVNTALAISGALSGGSLTKTGTGTLTLAYANDYTGGTTVSAGTLKVGNAAAIPSSGYMTVNGTLDLNGYSVDVNSLSGSTTGIVTSGKENTAVTLTAHVPFYGSTEFLGVIEDGLGTVELETAGYGTLTLTGSNTYTGGTLIGSDTMVAFGSGGLGNSGSIAFGNHATLKWAADNTRDVSSRLVFYDYCYPTFDVGSNDVTLARARSPPR